MSVYQTSPVLKDYLWGGTKLETLFGRDGGGKAVAESWEVSVHPAGESAVNGVPLSKVIAANPHFIDKKGSPLPVLIKYIDAAQNLSVQVHPNDEYALVREGDHGKTETWYIVSAEEGAGIYCGLKQSVSREEFAAAVARGTVEELLNFIPVRAGDCYLIEAGTVHAIGAGCVICEIQQNSNVTYRVYDYNRVGADGKPRELHLAKALDVIDFSAFVNRTGTGAPQTVAGGVVRRLTSCRYFTCRELLLDGTYVEQNENSYVALCAIEGAGRLCGKPFGAGDSFIAPCGEKIELAGRAKIILTTLSEEL